MSNAKIAAGGPGSLGDLVRNGGDVAGNMDDAAVRGSGPGFWPDMARLGGNIVGPTISGTPVLDGQDGVAYAGFTASATGGTAPLVFALVGTWPDGITINTSTGAVTGTPTEDGTFEDLSVKVTDDNGHEDQLPDFTLVIDPA